MRAYLGSNALDIDMPSTPPELWTPLQLGASLASWYKVEPSSVVLNGFTVSQLTDKSGNGRHAVQANSSNQPTYVASHALANNKPAIVGAGQKVLTCGTTYLLREMFCVATHGTGTETTFRALFPPTLFSGSSLSPTPWVVGNTSQNFWFSGDHLGATTTQKNSVTVPYFQPTLPMPLSYLRFLNSSDQTRAWSLGNNPSVLNNAWDGVYCEFVCLNATLNLDDRQKLEGYLAWEWGIQASLPSGHPYLSAPP